MREFLQGFRAMLAIVPGVLPFGAIMGSVFSGAGLDFVAAEFMNSFVFAGASQLAAIDLLGQQASLFAILLTMWIINLRFMLYSAALSPIVKNSSLPTKIIFAQCLTDQTYAVLMAFEESFRGKETAARLRFYFGAATCMLLAWHSSVVFGFFLGKTAPESLALDFAVPLSFVAMLTPSLKSWSYLYVAIFSGICSLLLYRMPMNLGLITTALLALGLAYFLQKNRGKRQ